MAIRTLQVLAVVLLGACEEAARDPGGPLRASGEPRRQVLVILLDSARADRMSCYGYARETTPNIDALAKQGTLFRAHYTQGTNSRSVLPALLYSRYFSPPIFPLGDEIPLSRPEELFQGLDKQCISFPQLFRGAGYLTAGMSAHIWTRAESSLARQFDQWHDLSESLPVEDNQLYPQASHVVDYVIGWIEDHREQDWLLYVHLMDTHFPHLFGPDARRWHPAEAPALDRFDPGGRLLSANQALTVQEKAYLDALYDGSLLSVDRELGRLFDRLAGSDLLENGLLALTSDHGEGLMERPRLFEHRGPWYEPVARIPMILVGEKRVPVGAVQSLTGLVDVLPTLAGLMEIALPAGVRTDGIDLSPHLEGAPMDRDFIASDGGLRMGRWKAQFHVDAAALLGRVPEMPALEVRGSLYDLEADPGEKVNLWGKRRAQWETMVMAFREKLGPAFERFQNAKSTKTPRDPFAIGAWSFELSPPAMEGPKDLEIGLREIDFNVGWAHTRAWPHFYLLGRGRPDPITISFTIPDGVYEVEFLMSGQCEVRFPGDEEWRPAQSRSFNYTRPTRTGLVSLGNVAVKGGKFEAEVRATSLHCYLRSIGFAPLRSGGHQ